MTITSNSSNTVRSGPLYDGRIYEDLFYRAGTLGLMTMSALSLIFEPTGLLVSAVFFGVVATTLVHPLSGVLCIVALTPFESFLSLDFAALKMLKLALVSIIGMRLYLEGWGQASKNDPYRKVMYGLIGAAILPTLLSSSPGHSALGLMQIVVFWGLYLALGRLRMDEHRSALVLRSLVAVSGPIAAIAILQAVVGYDGLLSSREQQLMSAQGLFSTFWPSVQRASATFGSDNAAGAFFGVSALVALLHSFLLRGHRIAYGFMSLTSFIALLFTFSRGALLGLLAGVFIVVCVIGRPRLKWVAGISILSVTLALFISVPLVQVLGYLRVGDDLLSASVSRVKAWQGAAEIISQHPISGIGFYEFKGEMANLEDGDPDAPAHPHNGILKAVVEEGLPGGLAYLYYVAVFLKIAVSTLRRFAARPAVLWIFASIAAAGICLFTQELVDAGLTMGGSSLAILFSIFLAVQVGLQDFLEAQALCPLQQAL